MHIGEARVSHNICMGGPLRILASHTRTGTLYAYGLPIIVHRAGGNGPAAPVLAGPVFLKVKMKFNFYKKQLMNKSASVIFVLFRLIILSYNR